MESGRLSTAGVSELLAEVVEEILPSLGELRRRALEAALLLDRAEPGAAAEPRTVALAVLDSLKLLSAESPVVVAVDDFQWLDTESVRVLVFAIRRLGEKRVGALLAVRQGTSAADRSRPRIPAPG